MADDNPRPLKRQRVESIQDTVKDASNAENLSPIPPSALLLALPSFLIHPPTHPDHQSSLQLSSTALKKCLELPEIEGDLECRAWTALAEVGIIQGIQEPGTAEEVEKAISKALLIAQKHPSLRLYKPHLSLLSARVAYHHQNNPKHAAQIVRRLLNTLTPSDPPHVAYTAHLALISYIETESSTKVLDSVQNLQMLAANNGHSNVALLALVIRLRIQLSEGLWPTVGSSLNEAEEALQIIFPNPSANSPLATEVPAAETALRLHLLIMGVVYHTYAGDIENVSLRLTRLHELLDKGALTKLGEFGIIEFPLAGERTLYVQMTHPRILYLLGFLVSSVSKRNPVGRKPKRKVFATEGLTIAERELKKEIDLPKWASDHEAKGVYSRIHKLKADLLSELVANSICRSEFEDAEKHLNALVAHTRNTSLFHMFAAQITLHHAHLSHSLGQAERALDCYKVAAYLSRSRGEDDNGENSCPRTPRKWAPSPTSRVRDQSPSKRKSPVKKRSKSRWRLSEMTEDDDGLEQCPEDTWVHASARTGEIWLRIGLIRQRARTNQDNKDSTRSGAEEIEQLVAEGEALARQCEGLGGTLRAVGEVLKACLSNEVLKSKGHLRTALDLTSASQDNHLRALIIALISSHYFHTARDHAENMLLTSEQLAAGMGAQPRRPSSGISTGKPPLATSDKVNTIQKDPNTGTYEAAKPRSKRKAGESEPDENHTPSLQPLKGKTDINDAPYSQVTEATGNAQLRLWIGERFLELSRWAGDEEKVKKHEAAIRKFKVAVRGIEERAGVINVG